MLTLTRKTNEQVLCTLSSLKIGLTCQVQIANSKPINILKKGSR